MQELAALETALRNKERELSTAAAEREDAEAQAVMELDSARHVSCLNIDLYTPPCTLPIIRIRIRTKTQ